MHILKKLFLGREKQKSALLIENGFFLFIKITPKGLEL